MKTDPSADGGTTYTVTGTSEILSTPYALYAKNVETETQNLADVLTQSNDGNATQIILYVLLATK